MNAVDLQATCMYLGFVVTLTANDISVKSPCGRISRGFTSMKGVRLFVKAYRKEERELARG